MNNKVDFDLTLYAEKQIVHGIKAYQNICTITKYRSATDRMTCYFACPDDEFEMISDEFCNYIIALMNVKDGLQ